MEVINEIIIQLDSYPSFESVEMKRDIYYRRPITKEEYEKVISENDMKLKMPLHNNYKFFEDIIVEGPVSVEKLLMEIYQYYQRNLKKEHIKKAFWGLKELKDEVMEMYDNDETQIKNIDVFSTDPDATFEGLEKIKKRGEDNYYGLLLGPL